MKTYLKTSRRNYVEFRTEDKSLGLNELIAEFGGFISTQLTTEDMTEVSFFNVSDNDAVIVAQFEAGLRELDYVQIT